jgi:MFS family permease
MLKLLYFGEFFVWYDIYMPSLQKKKIVRLFYLISICDVLARNLLGPVYAVYVTRIIHGNLLDSGIALAISTCVMGLLIVVSGRIASKYRTEKLQMVIGYLMAALVYLGFIVIKTPVQLYILEAVSGIASAIELPASTGLFSSIQEENKHSKGWGEYFGLMNFVSAFSLLTSGFIAQRFGFHPLFLTMFSLELLGMLIAIYLLRFKNVHATLGPSV